MNLMIFIKGCWLPVKAKFRGALKAINQRMIRLKIKSPLPDVLTGPAAQCLTSWKAKEGSASIHRD